MVSYIITRLDEDDKMHPVLEYKTLEEAKKVLNKVKSSRYTIIPQVIPEKSSNN